MRLPIPPLILAAVLSLAMLMPSTARAADTPQPTVTAASGSHDVVAPAPVPNVEKAVAEHVDQVATDLPAVRCELAELWRPGVFRPNHRPTMSSLDDYFYRDARTRGGAAITGGADASRSPVLNC